MNIVDLIVRPLKSLALLGVVLLAACGGSDLSRSDIKLAAGDLRSFASAGRLLCEQSQQTTTTFFQTQASSLKDKIHSTGESLNGSAADAEAERQKAAAIAGELETVVGRWSEDPSACGGSMAEIEKLKVGAKDLEDDLAKGE